MPILAANFAAQSVTEIDSPASRSTSKTAWRLFAPFIANLTSDDDGFALQNRSSRPNPGSDDAWKSGSWLRITRSSALISS